MKKTKREMYAELREAVANNAEMVEFIDHEVEILNRKNTQRSNKPTKTQLENEGIKERIVAYMSEKPTYSFTISELIKALPNEETGDLYSTSKMSSLMRQLREAGKVKREEIKRRAYYSLVIED